MSDKTAKRKKGKAAGGEAEAGVLGNLPATRTTGLRADREGNGRGKAAPRSGARAKPKAAAKPQTAAKRKAAAKPKAAATAKSKAATAPPPAKPKLAAATPAPEPATPHRPRPVRAGAPALAESTERARVESSDPLEPGAAPPSGTELVTTAIQAAGELAQIGLKMGGHALKRAVDKLPKP